MTCNQCNKELTPLYKTLIQNNGIEKHDCKSSFVNIHSFFYADVIRCVGCDKYHLYGYYEDFDNTPIHEEFGDRYWIEREITKTDFEFIKENANKFCLDINTFGEN
jgi:hypothetical protein